MPRILYTLGHSNRSLEEFKKILTDYNIEAIVDIRRWPTSRKNPHFNRETLEKTVEKLGITYHWMGDTLGGYRRMTPEASRIKCFESNGFKAYAYYITTDARAWRALEEIADIAGRKTTLILCSERLPWRCHRKIVSDWLLWRGFKVIHIIDPGHETPHKYTNCAKIVDGRLVYL
ncbi:MAG: DUF488 family protein [Desulfurococcales archaeon]|nr:DUF488 family protein [Desulfurococcales archaeon]